MSVVQIAAQAGVSIATVSRVMNNSRRVNPKIADQVRKAMEELNFSPRKLRRRNRLRASEKEVHTIAVVSLGQQLRGWFEMPVIAAAVGKISQVAQEQQIGVLITEMPDPEQLSSVLLRQQVDGALAFIGSNFDTRVAGTLGAHLPVIRVMGGQLGPVDIDHVGSDNNAVGYMAAEHLLAQGCKTLIYFTQQPAWDLSRLRAQGFVAAATKAMVRPSVFIDGDAAHHQSFYGGSTVGGIGMSAAVGMLADGIKRFNGQGPIGLFVARDEETVGVYRHLADHGVHPGRDVTVVSCDNEDARLSTLHPRPASIELGAEQLARQAISRLIWRIRNPEEPPVRILVSPRMVLPSEHEAASFRRATTFDVPSAFGDGHAVADRYPAVVQTAER